MLKCGECPIYGLKIIPVDGHPWKLCPLDKPEKGRIRLRFEDTECDYSLTALMQAECHFRVLADGLSQLVGKLEAMREAEERAV